MAKAHQRFKPWHPFKANLTPPSGFYDPTLDANLGSVTRGLQDTTADTQTQQGRLTSDNALGHAAIDQSFSRSSQDIATQRAAGTADHAQQLADLSQAYGQRAQSQAQSQNAMGVLQGGAALQAAMKRAANQQHDQVPLDTNFQRLMSGLDTAQSRAGQDQQQQGGMLDLNTLRSTQDLTTTETRAQREANAFGLDTKAAKAAQAAGAGWNPYAGRNPAERGSGANARRTVVRNGIAYVIDPSGRVVSKRKAG